MGKAAKKKQQTREDIDLIKSVIPAEDFNQRLKEFSDVYGPKKGKEYTIAYYFDYLKKFIEKSNGAELVVKK